MPAARNPSLNEIRSHHEVLQTGYLVILGCGALGTAILLGLLSGSSTPPTITEVDNVNSSKTIPKRFIACVRRDGTADAVRRALKKGGTHDRFSVDVRVCDNVNAVQKADIILLAVQPHLLNSLLDEPGLRQALIGKLIVSVLAGVTVQDIEIAIRSKSGPPEQNDKQQTYIVRAMPNINCFAKQSTTVIERGSAPQHILDSVSNLFKSVGEVFFTEPSTMDACTALCGSTSAFFTVILDGLVDGAIATGLKADDALKMAAHAMMGTACLILQGRKPADVRHEVTSPGGSTIQGVLSLEEQRTRWILAKALQIATTAASKLGSKDDGNAKSQ